MSDPTPRLRAVDGRVPGRRGRETRQRLLAATRSLIDEVTYRELAVVDVARRAGTSPATFYQYFPDVEAPVLALSADLADGGEHELRSLVTAGDWSTAESGRVVADGFLAFFDQHRALLRAIDIGALEGNHEFRSLRTRVLNGVYRALRDVVHEAQAAGRVDAAVEPSAMAGVLTSMLAHVAAHQDGFETWGVPADSLADAMAGVLTWSVGAWPRDL